MKSTQTAYGRTAVWFHWLSALLILLMAPIGLIMVRMPDGASGQQALYRVHIFMGILVLLLSLGRIIWRFIDVQPKMPAGMQGVQLWMYRLTHYGLYLFLIAMLSTGIGMLALSGAPMPPAPLDVTVFRDLAPRAGHGVFSKVFIVLFFLHLGGVLMHQFKEGNVLKRMGVNLGAFRAD